MNSSLILSGFRALSWVVLQSLVWLGASNAATWYVNVDGTGDAPTIQAAIDSAGPGDAVLVDAGDYTWSNQGGDSTQFFGPSMLVMRSDIVLRSLAGPESTVVDAEGFGRVVLCNGVFDSRIEGLTLRGGHAADPDSAHRTKAITRGECALLVVQQIPKLKTTQSPETSVQRL